MKFNIASAILFISLSSFSQSEINGIVQDKNINPIFEANIYLKSAPQKGVISDFEGNFQLRIANFKDTLVASYIGYKTKHILIADIDITEIQIIS